MKQVVQDIGNGKTSVREIPDPVAVAAQVVVQTMASLVSAGTERYVVELARKSLLGKAWDRPDQVRRVLQKMKTEGVATTLTQVMAKLDEPMPLGYSSAGIVLECGRGVTEFRPGDRVATAGPHAGVVSVGRNLCAKIPGGVSFEQAAYAAVGAIALQGVRLAKLSLGERVLVIGLGLVGQLCVGLLEAMGCRVFGMDLDPKKLEQARKMGLVAGEAGASLAAVRAFAGPHGVDAAIITAATSSNEPIEFSAEACRPKGRIVLVGVAGLHLPRAPFFAKELEFTVSSSLGPGRNDPVYEEKGVDYPIGYARWTAQRNLQAVLEVIASGKLPVQGLTSHRFPIAEADRAIELITSGEPSVGIIIDYPQAPVVPARKLELASRRATGGELGVSVIGAGNFARLMMLPIVGRLGDISLRGICSAKGLRAEHSGRTKGFAYACSEVAELWRDTDTHAVFIATRHDLHADLVIAGLRAGKHVFVEKPLCIKAEELARITACVEELGERCPVLMVGFNRRFTSSVAKVRDFFSGSGPLSVSYRFGRPELPPTSWTQDEEVGGGRIVGDACHAIDACVALTGSLPSKVFAEATANSDDCVVLVVRHQDGSVSNVSYQAGGDPAFPSERVEIFGGGGTAVIENWASLQLWRDGRAKTSRGRRELGHEKELGAFVAACRAGRPWPIPWEQLHAVSWASLVAVQSLRDGAVQVDRPDESL